MEKLVVREDDIHGVKFATIISMRVLSLSLFLATLLLTTNLARAEQSAQSTVQLVNYFPVVFHVAVKDGSPITAKTQVDQELARANINFYGAGIGFRVHELRHLPEGHSTLRTVPDRRRLRRYFMKRKINVFVVEEILDARPSKATLKAAAAVGLDPSDGRLAGAHIPAKGLRPSTYIIVTRSSMYRSFTHELGHFFGAPHSKNPDNFMSYGPNPFQFSERQLNYFRRRARHFRRSRSLVPVL